MIDNPLSSIDIRVGTADDTAAIIEFASSISEDPFSSREKWYEILENNNTYPLLALYRENIVGKLHAQIIGELGWLESTQVRSDFRRVGIAHTLVDAGMDWLIAKGVKRIRTVVDSDNIAARKILERHHFNPSILTINPSAKVQEADAAADNTADIAPILDESLFQKYRNKLSSLQNNVMVDGKYVKFTQELFDNLIEERRLYTNHNQSIMLILSEHQLPSEYHGFLIADTEQGYQLGGKSLRAFAGRELSTIAICHAPSTREATIGLAKLEFSWNQPHTLILYERESWQERDNNQ